MAENKTLKHAAQAEAKQRAERIRKGLPGWRATMADIIAAYQERDWAVLGYDSWEVYVADQFGSLPQFQSTDERNQVIMKLSAEGMTQREMSAATGASQPTVSRALANGEAGAARDSSESPDPEADETQDGADDEESIRKALIAANARPRAAGKQSPRQAAATKREAGKRTTRPAPASKPPAATEPAIKEIQRRHEQTLREAMGNAPPGVTNLPMQNRMTKVIDQLVELYALDPKTAAGQVHPQRRREYLRPELAEWLTQFFLSLEELAD